MKKIISAVVLAFAVASQAAFQYEVKRGEYKIGSGNDIAGWEYWVEVTEGKGQVFIADKIASLYGGNTEVLANVATMDDKDSYGWIDYNDETGTKHSATGESFVLYSKSMNQWNEVVTQMGYVIGEFSAGDKIGIFLTDKAGNSGASVLDKTVEVNKDSITYRSFGDNVFGQTVTDYWGNPLAQLDLVENGAGTFFVIGGKEIPATGQPLPGVLASMAIGAAVFAIRKRSKKNK